jgi:hypothetical protein
MIAMQWTRPDPSRRRAPEATTAATLREGARCGTAPADRPATVTAPFLPLDPGIVSEAIPAFFIGRNKEGFWIARDANGRVGGIFLLENSALSFAKQNSRPAGCATIFPSERFELDLENRGNRLAAHLGPLVRLTTRHGAMIRRFSLCALTALLAGGALAGIIALKAGFYLSRLNY